MSLLRRIPCLILLAAAAALPASADPCSVPGSHATIQDAIDDPVCTSITLAAQTYPESIEIVRSLGIAGPAPGGAVIEGHVLVAGSSTQAELVDLEVRNGCSGNALEARGGAKVDGTRLAVVRSSALPCPPLASAIFADGFESGDTSAW